MWGGVALGVSRFVVRDFLGVGFGGFVVFRLGVEGLYFYFLICYEFLFVF